MYYIYNIVEDTWDSYEDWWKLIGKFFESYRDPLFGSRQPLFNFRDIAHNKNDTYTEHNFDHDKDLGRHVYQRSYIIYDEDQIVNLSEIRESAKKYRAPERNKHYRFMYRSVVFEYRNGPVPYTGGRGYGGYYRSNIRKNKNYVASMQEYADIFPSDARLRQAKFFVSLWDDDSSSSKCGKSWKKQKKRKQWQ